VRPTGRNVTDDYTDPSPLLTALAEARFDATVDVAAALARKARALAERRFAAGTAGSDATAAHNVIAEVQLLERLLRRARIAREHGDPLHRLLRETQAAIRAVMNAIAALNRAAYYGPDTAP
jgi:hypothetical protein